MHAPVARILVSEDNPGIQQIYSRLLPSYGFELICVADGDGVRTIEMAREIRPQLVITDVNKPTMDGHALVAALHADSSTAHIPVLMVTAMDQRSNLYWSGRVPADDYIVKPFPFADLLYRMTAMIAWAGPDHDELVERAINLPCYDRCHPATGLPCLHQLAAEVPIWSARPGWAAVELSLANHRALLDTYGHPLVDALAVGMGNAIYRVAGSGLLVGHTSFDLSVAIIGPSAQVAAAEMQLIIGLANLAYPRTDHVPAPRIQIGRRHASDQTGLHLSLPALRAALRH